VAGYDAAPDSPARHPSNRPKGLSVQDGSRVLVTGASGFIGTNLVRDLASRHELCALDVAPPRDPSPPAIRMESCDVRDGAQLRAVIADLRPDIVFHLAARTDMSGRDLDAYSSTTVGTENLLAAIAELDQPVRTVITSSRLVCQTGYIPTGETDYNPNTVYGESKVAQEEIVRAKAPENCLWTILRPTSIWGPFFEVPYRNFFEAIKRGVYLHPRGGPILKSMGYVGNTTVQLARVASLDGPEVIGRTFHVADYEPTEVGRWADLIATAYGRSVRRVPRSLLRAVAAAGDLLGALGVQDPPLTSFRYHNLVAQMVYPLVDLKAHCGPNQVTLEEGVSTTVAWLEAEGR
jgi:GlcNAc-P-P-Und epimerase